MLCYYLAIRCLLEAREFTEALQVLTDVEQEGSLFSNTYTSFDSSIPVGCDDVTPNVSHMSWIPSFMVLLYRICITLLYTELCKVEMKVIF